MTEYEYAVMYKRISTTEPHRGPFDTREKANRWIADATEDGFLEGVFGVYRRPTGVWEEDVLEPEVTPKFKVGDRVRVMSDGLFAPLGEIFTVTGNKPRRRNVLLWASEGGSGNYWCTGDRNGVGVWEDYLELVE